MISGLSINVFSNADLEIKRYSKIGFVGLGNMGGHMAKNLLKKVSNNEIKFVELSLFHIKKIFVINSRILIGLQTHRI